MRDGALFTSSRDRVGFEMGMEARGEWLGRGISPAGELPRRRTELRTRLHHYSLLGYAVPVSRLTRILPERLSLVKDVREGAEVGWVWVQSFRDEGGVGESVANSRGSVGFEQTTYSVSVETTDGQAQYLLGHSIGSLSAVGARHLWAQPWHLSAMELQVAWHSSVGECREYRLHSQSQWDNSRWEFEPAGGRGLATHFPTGMDYLFSRGGAGLGQRRVRWEELELQPVRVVQARSEFLERSGLVRGAELSRPALAGVQQVVRAVVDLVDGEFGSPAPARLEPSRRSPVLFQAA